MNVNNIINIKILLLLIKLILDFISRLTEHHKLKEIFHRILAAAASKKLMNQTNIWQTSGSGSLNVLVGGGGLSQK